MNASNHEQFVNINLRGDQNQETNKFDNNEFDF